MAGAGAGALGRYSHPQVACCQYGRVRPAPGPRFLSPTLRGGWEDSRCRGLTQLTPLLTMLGILRASRGFGPLRSAARCRFGSLWLPRGLPGCGIQKFGLVWPQIRPVGRNIEHDHEHCPGVSRCGGHKSHPFTDGYKYDSTRHVTLNASCAMPYVAATTLDLPIFSNIFCVSLSRYHLELPSLTDDCMC